ncbi:MAG TPA: hypothetical protein VMM37_05100 [Bacteroidota bacterium]|nr:hypothetical protein [Bacteroidota bacterium]
MRRFDGIAALRLCMQSRPDILFIFESAVITNETVMIEGVTFAIYA